MIRNITVERVTTTYWNGVTAVDRKLSSSHIQLKINEDVKRSDLTKTGKIYSFPVSIFVNGSEVDSGTCVIKTIKNSMLEIGECRYAVIVVRTTTNRNNGAPINHEDMLGSDAGMLLENVAMTPNWQAKHGVFYDKVGVNQYAVKSIACHRAASPTYCTEAQCLHHCQHRA